MNIDVLKLVEAQSNAEVSKPKIIFVARFKTVNDANDEQSYLLGLSNQSKPFQTAYDMFESENLYSTLNVVSESVFGIYAHLYAHIFGENVICVFVNDIARDDISAITSSNAARVITLDTYRSFSESVNSININDDVYEQISALLQIHLEAQEVLGASERASNIADLDAIVRERNEQLQSLNITGDKVGINKEVDEDS